MDIAASAALGAHQRALTEVAVDVLRTGAGGKIATSLQLQERLDVGSGTVQKALRQLVDTGAVRLRVKGHQGTIVEALDPALLWRSAALSPLRITLTTPGAIEPAVIALGLRSQLGMRQIGVEYDFIRGAENRLAAIAGERRVAILSLGAAHEHGVIDNAAYSTMDLGPGTYYSPETLVVLSRRGIKLGAPVRVARDSESFDHTQLTKREFPRDDVTTYVDCAFPDVPSAILDGHADAGVWHTTVTAISPAQAGLDVRPINWDLKDAQLRGLSHGLLVWRSDFREVNELLGLLDLEQIRSEQTRLAAQGVGSAEVRSIVPWL